MAMDTANPAYVAGRLEELERENTELREQLRRLAVHQQVSRNALSEAVGQKETAAQLAHKVTVEERATRAAVEVAGTNVGFSVILQIVNFFALLITIIIATAWLPAEIERRVARPVPVATQAPNGTTIITQPGR